MKLFGIMPIRINSKKQQYDMVREDYFDMRIPLHNEAAFQHGIHFQAKYIGSLEVPRPTNRVEIVAAMRRIRYEFKAKGMTKQKVDICISTDGVNVILKKKRKKNDWTWDENSYAILKHPIPRIFYVSHDSQDLKIFSYIARDCSSGLFNCHVFKANKKSQALLVVRTVGQAFEVCHQHSLQEQAEKKEVDKEHAVNTKKRQKVKEEAVSSLGAAVASCKETPSKASSGESSFLSSSATDSLKSTEAVSEKQQDLTPAEVSLTSPVISPHHLPEDIPLNRNHQHQQFCQQLAQQQQEKCAAVAQVHLLRDQLSAETSARIEAQARTHQLLLQNRDLLVHIQTLINQLRDLEIKLYGNSVDSCLPTPTEKLLVSLDSTTPQSGPVMLPRFLESVHQQNSSEEHQRMYANRNANGNDSPDSGHKEMSSYSLLANLMCLGEEVKTTQIGSPGLPENADNFSNKISNLEKSNPTSPTNYNNNKIANDSKVYCNALNQQANSLDENEDHSYSAKNESKYNLSKNFERTTCKANDDDSKDNSIADNQDNYQTTQQTNNDRIDLSLDAGHLYLQRKGLDLTLVPSSSSKLVQPLHYKMGKACELGEKLSNQEKTTEKRSDNKVNENYELLIDFGKTQCCGSCSKENGDENANVISNSSADEFQTP